MSSTTLMSRLAASATSASTVASGCRAARRDRWGPEHGLTVRRMAVSGRLHRRFDDPVDQPVVLCHLRRHEEVALDVTLNLLGGSTGVLRVDADDDLPQPEDL